MITGLEFFNLNGETWCRMEDGTCRPFCEDCRELTDQVFRFIAENYPECHKALLQCYCKSAKNIAYYKFLMVRKFIRCNFGEVDNIEDIDGNNVYNLEHVSCPMRGECRWENIICHPKRSTRLSLAEERVMQLVCEGMGTEEIADRLYLSYYTVKKHMANAYRKIGVKNKAEFIVYAGRNRLWPTGSTD